MKIKVSWLTLLKHISERLIFMHLQWKINIIHKFYANKCQSKTALLLLDIKIAVFSFYAAFAFEICWKMHGCFPTLIKESVLVQKLTFWLNTIPAQKKALLILDWYDEKLIHAISLSKYIYFTFFHIYNRNFSISVICWYIYFFIQILIFK